MPQNISSPTCSFVQFSGGQITSGRWTAGLSLFESLGQLSERLNYDKLYEETLSDPELGRTRLELEAALGNAEEALRVAFDLFQDLDDFRLDDYKPFSDVKSSMERLVHFVSESASCATRGHRTV
jgi:hypothetical protein